MRIVIDLQGAQTASRFRGIGRYTMALTHAILRNAGKHEIWLVLNGALEESITGLRMDFERMVPRDRIRVFETPGRIAESDIDASPRCRAAEMLREQFIAALDPDIVLVTSLFEGYTDDAVCSVGAFVDGVRTAVILYDLIPLLNPDTYLPWLRLREFYMRKVASLGQAGLLLSISDYAREEALGALALAPDRVVAVSSAVDEGFAPAELTPAARAAIHARFGITRPFVMCAPGGYDARKNLAGLVTAYAMLPPALRAGHQLLVASRFAAHDRRQLEAHARRQGLARNELILTGYVGDEELVSLYQAAALFVLPSLHEGFGLPALEAMACGAPVIGSNTTSIPEVIGLQDALFDPHQPQSIATRIAEVLLDPALRERLCTHGRVQAQKFSWDQTARRALRALEAHVAATAAPPVRPRGALMEALAGLPGLPGDECTLLQLALCFAAMPDLGRPRRLLVDPGPAACGAGSGRGASAGSALLQALLRSPPHGLSVVPVVLSAQRGVWHYRHGPGEYGRTAPAADGGPTGAVADIGSGDLVLTLGLVPAAFDAACTDGLLAHLRRLGVGLHFIMEAQVGEDAAGDGWRDALVAYADRILCMNAGTAAAFDARRALLPPGRHAARIDAVAAQGDVGPRVWDWLLAALQPAGAAPGA